MNYGNHRDHLDILIWSERQNDHIYWSFHWTWSFLAKNLPNGILVTAVWTMSIHQLFTLCRKLNLIYYLAHLPILGYAVLSFVVNMSLLGFLNRRVLDWKLLDKSSHCRGIQKKYPTLHLPWSNWIQWMLSALGMNSFLYGRLAPLRLWPISVCQPRPFLQYQLNNDPSEQVRTYCQDGGPGSWSLELSRILFWLIHHCVTWMLHGISVGKHLAFPRTQPTVRQRSPTLEAGAFAVDCSLEVGWDMSPENTEAFQKERSLPSSVFEQRC